MAEQVPGDSEKIELEVFTKFKSILRPNTYKDFPILVRVTAPSSTERSSVDVDLVAVLDNSGSMRGEKMEMTKEAMKFVIDHLSSTDRLAILSFKDYGNQRIEFPEMSDSARSIARGEVGNLLANGGNDMGGALQKAAEILQERGAEESNTRVGCIIFLSDGEDNNIYKQEISPEFRAETFGLGAHHDPRVLRYIADSTSGVYSFVNQEMDKIKDAFAMSIGGLKSVTATSVQIDLNTLDVGVTISSIDSGGYRSQVTSDGRSGSINIDNIYAGEEKNFIVYLTVPEGEKPTFFGLLRLLFGDGQTKLMTVGGSYKNPKISNEGIKLDADDVSVLRPEKLPNEGAQEISPEVATELVRLQLVKGVSLIAEKPNGAELQELWDGIKNSQDGHKAAKEGISDLEKDVTEMMQGIENANMHKRKGLPYMLSWLTSHKWQRATTKGSPSEASSFQTNEMKEMVRKLSNGDNGLKPIKFRKKRVKVPTLWERVVTRAKSNPSSCVLPFGALLVVLFLIVYFGVHAGTTVEKVVEQETVTTTMTTVVFVSDDGNSDDVSDIAASKGLNGEKSRTNLDISQHPNWPKMEKHLQLMFNKFDDLEITSYLQDASVEDMNHKMHQYLYLAIVHAGVLGRRYTSIPEDVGVTISMLKQAVETLEMEKKELSNKIQVLVQENEEMANTANTNCVSKENEEALERANTRIAELERMLHDKKLFAESLLSEIANNEAHLKTCNERVDMLETKVRELEGNSVVDAN